jgi:hypothetical protein
MMPRIYDGHASRNAAAVGVAWAAVALFVAVYFSPKATATGWLIGFAFWSQILLGALSLVMIHRLTGGRWGVIAAPAIQPAAAAVPLLIVLAIPLFVALPVLYPWWSRPDSIKPDVMSYYLNAPAFIVRSLLALFGWSVLSWMLPRSDGSRSQLIAALGLTFHALVISAVAVDWYLSAEAPFTSSSFGASIAVSSLAAACAWAVFWPNRPSPEDPAIGDIGALLLTTVLGITYIDFMAVLVIWYGDLPRESTWFVERAPWPWFFLAAASFLLTSLLPVGSLLLSKVRNARRPLRIVGVSVLAGLACYDSYLIAPLAGAAALATGAIAIVGMGLGLTAILSRGFTLRVLPEQADVH